MTSADALHTAFLYLSGILASSFCGLLFYKLCCPFVAVRGRLGVATLVLTMGVSFYMVIWIGDPNLLYTFPIYLGFFMLATQGERLGRLALSIIFFCLSMSIAALLDTYLNPRTLSLLDEALGTSLHTLDPGLLTRLARPFLIGLIYLGFRRFLPAEQPVLLSRHLWALVLALSLMPLCALAATVLLSDPIWEAPAVYAMTLRLGIAVLPFVLATSLVLLAAILVLARQHALEQEQALQAERARYYAQLQERASELRQLRHDLRNHITAASGLLALGKTDEAAAYLAQLGDSKALGAPRRYCDHEAANIVLAAKADALAQADIASDFQISLPPHLPFADTDLCALLGNALDNAREGARGCPDATVHLRCRYDKGLLMLSVDNPIRHIPDPQLRTTKADKRAHGHGLPSMRSICARYHGSLDTTISDHRFTLLVCLSDEEA